MTITFLPLDAGIDDVTALPESAFSESTGRSLGYRNDALWAKIPIENQSSTEHWFIVQYVTHIGKVSVYRVDADLKSSHIETTGRDFHPEERIIDLKNPTIPFDIKQGFKGWLYIRMESENNLMLSVNIRSSRSVMELANKDGLYHGFYYGFLAALISYVLFLIFYLKQRLYGRYLLYLLSMGLFQSIVTHDASSFLWPGKIAFDKFIETFSLGLVIITSGWFLIGYTSSGQDKGIRYILKTCILAGLVICIFSLINDSYAFNLKFTLCVALFCYPLILLALFRAWRTGIECAGLMCFGWSVMTTGMYYQVLHKFGYLTSTLSFNLFQVACMVDFVLFTAAISEKVKKLSVDLDSYVKINLGFLGVSHEMKKPLSALEDLKNYLKKIIPSEDGTANFILNHADKTLDATRNIIYDALDMGHAELKSEHVDLFEIAIEAASYIKFDINHIYGKKCMITADKQKLKRGLINLMDNAMKFNKDNLRKPFVKVESTGTQKKITVKNFGKPISKDEVRNIFKRNFSASGHGLGMYLTKIIADIHGWQITCLSDHTEQSVTFEIIFSQ
ncbi:MAG: sensor histidine kinase [Deltaproteobacteria bacterium]|nr:sensor histidine kinase [Deltaproteobacteria bacterium]